MINNYLKDRIKQIQTTPDWFKDSFPEQRKFIEDPALLKAAYCTRRAGKSYGAGLYMCKVAYENPGVSILYIALSRTSANRIMWKDVLRQINSKFNLGCKFNEYELKMVFPNGSIIYLDGADTSETASDKFLGQKFKLVVIDEAAKFKTSVQQLVYDILKPAVADYEGTIAMIGTTNNFVKSYFAKVTQYIEGGWSVHRWSALNNPYMRKQFTNEMKRLRESNPNVDNEPWFRQNYLAEWVVDTASLLYKYPQKSVQESAQKKMRYVLGLLTAYDEKAYFALVGYSTKSRIASIIDTHIQENSSLNKLNEIVGQYQDAYNLTAVVCADDNKNLQNALRTRFALPILDAVSYDPNVARRLFIDDLKQSFISIHPEGNKRLLEEWDSTIISDKPALKRRLVEHELSPAPLSKAVIAAWNYCYNYTFKPGTPPSDDPMDTYWENLKERLQNEPEYDEFESSFFTDTE